MPSGHNCVCKQIPCIEEGDMMGLSTLWLGDRISSAFAALQS